MMRSGLLASLWVILVVGLLVIGSQSRAIEPTDVLVFSRDPFLLRPRVSLSESYNDNLFSQPNGEGDLITTVSPGFNLQLGKQVGNNLSLDYGFNRHFYLDRSDLNSGEHSFGFRTRIQGKRLLFTGSDSIQLLSSPIGLVAFVSTPQAPVDSGSGTGAGGGGTTPDPIGGDPIPISGGEVITSVGSIGVERSFFSDSYNLGYGISEKTGVYLQGSHFTQDYQEGVVINDINTIRATGGFGYQAFPKTALFGEVFYGQTATTPNIPSSKPPHVEFLGGFLGARGRFTGKLSGSVRVGLESREFSDGTSAPKTPVANLSLDHRFSDKTAFSLTFSRSSDVSIQYSRESFTANVTSLQWTQMLGSSGKWRSSVGGSYGALSFESSGSVQTRDYNQYSANFGLAYQIQLWLSASLGYSHQRIQSSSEGIPEYNVNQIGMSLSVGY